MPWSILPKSTVDICNSQYSIIQDHFSGNATVVEHIVGSLCMYGNATVVENIEREWQELIFQRIRVVFGFGI
jgi:hypothetical protein